MEEKIAESLHPIPTTRFLNIVLVCFPGIDAHSIAGFHIFIYEWMDGELR